eukprot:CAMPEP_0175180732 /NCGR_PEP_ID=MMETSP0087-20121206/36253_1 /TAXON_ID=136419 /ORGANISM="Unknown Unknown, Strain D1" /LENGTH=139 /DNA_ID=CAMNT_0016473149 /DNA_START=183 /DNA_END=602 /DNA_ORIENTATION=-
MKKRKKVFDDEDDLIDQFERRHRKHRLAQQQGARDPVEAVGKVSKMQAVALKHQTQQMQTPSPRLPWHLQPIRAQQPQLHSRGGTSDASSGSQKKLGPRKKKKKRERAQDNKTEGAPLQQPQQPHTQRRHDSLPSSFSL